MTARDRKVLVIVLALGVIAACWMLVVQPKRSRAANLNSQVHTLQKQLATARDSVSKGLAARNEFSGDYTELARLGEALPEDDDVPSLIFQIQSAAGATGVDFRTLSLSPGSGSAAPAPAPATTSGSSSTTSTTAGTATTPGTTTASAATLPPGVSVGAAGFPAEQFSFTFSGNFFHLSDFFARLQRFVVAKGTQIAVSGRLLTINAISFSEGPKGFPQITANVSATTYLAPASTGLLNGATAAGPAGTTATPAASGTSSAAAPTATITAP
jgi:hypothetical protein